MTENISGRGSISMSCGYVSVGRGRDFMSEDENGGERRRSKETSKKSSRKKKNERKKEKKETRKEGKKEKRKRIPSASNNLGTPNLKAVSNAN